MKSFLIDFSDYEYDFDRCGYWWRGAVDIEFMIPPFFISDLLIYNSVKRKDC